MTIVVTFTVIFDISPLSFKCFSLWAAERTSRQFSGTFLDRRVCLVLLFHGRSRASFVAVVIVGTIAVVYADDARGSDE